MRARALVTVQRQVVDTYAIIEDSAGTVRAQEDAVKGSLEQEIVQVRLAKRVREGEGSVGKGRSADRYRSDDTGFDAGEMARYGRVGLVSGEISSGRSGVLEIEVNTHLISWHRIIAPAITL